ncbi:MAG: AbrB/MazE/SpoVT family DNA-binding domain-containing protein, partial [Chloroflexi bacterium]|nr:AbrB/MazE/SpoVT family DNA-binding domain-containing protein [Chloroflexota bacterium]
MRSRINSRGRTTIPPEVRDALGLVPGDEIIWVHDGDTFHISKVVRSG